MIFFHILQIYEKSGAEAKFTLILQDVQHTATTAAPLKKGTAVCVFQML